FTIPSFSGCTRGLSEKRIVSLSGMTHLPRGTPRAAPRPASLGVRERLPAGVRDVEDDLVGAGPLHLEVAVAAGSHGDVETVPQGQPLGPDGLQLLTRIVEVVDLEAEMVDAVVVGPVGSDVGVLFRLPVQDGQVDVAVGQEDGAARTAADLLESEAFLVERRDLVRVFRGQRNVLDPRHAVPSSCAQRGWVTVSISAGAPSSFTTFRPRSRAGRTSSGVRMGPSP